MFRLVLAFIVVPLLAFPQVRLNKLVLKKGETYAIPSGDILVIDSLIMGDSSMVRLNQEMRENFVHLKYFEVGLGVKITGRGAHGLPGKDGANGITPAGPCLDGSFGRGGTGGTHGDNGTNLYLYVNTFQIKGSLHIELRGGNGGDGGDGGIGGGGSPGTRVCLGGSGGTGGNGGSGGNGGNGGTLTISCKACPDLRAWMDEILFVRNFGGFAGVGGDGGQGGSAGLGSGGDIAKDGKLGTRGRKGQNGLEGKQGAVNFEGN